MSTEIAEAMPSRPTKRDLIDRGLEVVTPGTAKVSINAGGVQFATVAEVFDVAKAMATAGVHVPKYLRGNPGGCLGIIFQAVEWRMSPFSVAQKSYEVNDRVGYESQLIHAVVEARAPLRHRLDCFYEGGGSTRTCTVRGIFNNGDTRDYTTPEYKDIRIKNSPLWKDDPDQQLFYYASRSWARKWVPDVLMGIYAREELEQQETSPPGLHARLAHSEKSPEGHREGYATRELDQIAAKGQIIEHEPETSAEKVPASPPISADPVSGSDIDPTPSKRTRGRPRGSTNKAKPSEVLAAVAETAKPTAVSDSDHDPMPQNTADYAAYARAWITQAEDKVEIGQRWNSERSLRNKIGMTADDREPLELLISKKLSRGD